MLKKEENLGTVLAKLITFVRGIADKVDAVTPFYAGAADAEIPEWESCLEYLINPKFNGGARLLREFSAVVKTFARDSYPEGAFDELHDLVLELLRKVNALCAGDAFMMAMLHVSDFRNYLAGERSLVETGSHAEAIENAMRTLENRLDGLSLILHVVTDRLVHEHPRLRQANDRATRKRSGAKRKYTPRQEREILDFVQRPDFDTGRERNGRTCYNVTAAARAWAQLKHPKDMPQSAKAFSAAYDLLRRRPAPNAQ